MMQGVLVEWLPAKVESRTPPRPYGMAEGSNARAAPCETSPNIKKELFWSKPKATPPTLFSIFLSHETLTWINQSKVEA